MSVYDDNRQSVADAAEAVRKVQEEVANIAFDDETRRSRVVALLNNVSERLVGVHDTLVEDPDNANYADQPAERVTEDRPVVDGAPRPRDTRKQR